MNKQQGVMQLQQMQEQLEHLSQQQEIMQQQLLDIEISKNALLEIEQTPEGTEILSQVANGVFVKTKLVKGDSFIVNIGANATAEKKTIELISMYEDQEGKLVGHIESLQQTIQDLSTEIISKINKLEQEA